MDWVIVCDVCLGFCIIVFAIILIVFIKLYKKSMKAKNTADTLTNAKDLKKAFETKSKDLRYYFPTTINDGWTKRWGSDLAKYGMITLAVTIIILVIVLIVINSWYFSHADFNAHVLSIKSLVN